jgi:large subunit ribosomal protein L6
MSRIGKKPIALPANVKYTIDGNTVLVEGPKGKVTALIPKGITLVKKDSELLVERENDSHPIEFPLPTGIDVAIDPKQLHLTISGIDKQKVGQVAADMRSLRKPDPYKNKGVRYMGEKLKKKVGKTGAK